MYERENFRIPTPTASACKGSSKGSKTRKDGRSRINDRLDHAVEDGNGKLNPDWVEKLMGWPEGMTRLTPLPDSGLTEFDP